jgi:putative oxidoreductase
MGFLDKLRPLGLLVLRCALATIFIFHGYQKYTYGIAAVKAYMTSIGLPPWFAFLAIGLELGGGVLLLAGLATRPVALLLFGEMVVAIYSSDLRHGIKAVPSYEFAMITGAACLALATVGAGSISIDGLLFGRRGGGKPGRN